MAPPPHAAVTRLYSGGEKTKMLLRGNVVSKVSLLRRRVFLRIVRRFSEDFVHFSSPATAAMMAMATTAASGR